ncbi:MAG: nucleotidyltransferase domain-containing protein [candidate division NC10 bacterium]|nr:nucleotidyltransferase domain-containing protein [candidate division NC10 bacterium]
MGPARAERGSGERGESGGEFAPRLVETLRAAFGERLVSVVLFGSHARGEAKPESDVDIFLVVKGLPNSPLDRIGEVRRPVAGRFRERVAFITKTPEEVLAGLPSLYLDLALDGCVLFDTGFFRDRQAVLRGLIEEAGLRRVVRDGEYHWEWKTPPRRGWRLDWDGYRAL